MCLGGMVVRRYIDFLILPIPTPLVSALFFAAASTLFDLFFLVFHLFQYIFVIYLIIFAQYKQTYGRLRASHGSRMKGCT